MNKQAILQKVAASSTRADMPEIRPGMTVRVSQRIKEGDKERTQIFEGLVIATRGGQGVGGTYTVRKVVDGIGVEKTFPVHSKNVTKIVLVKQAKIRRSKLYYMRGLTGKAARMKETYFEAEAQKAAKAGKAAAAEKAAEAPAAEPAAE